MLESPKQVLSCEIWEISINTFFCVFFKYEKHIDFPFFLAFPTAI